jgi:hypothetical protein
MSQSLLNGFLIAAVSFLVVYGIFQLAKAIRVYARFRGQHLVSCPEDKQPAAVRVAAGKAAAYCFKGQGQISLKRCSHWPERAKCGQECLTQVENDPEGCLVWNQVQHWYWGRSCACCQQRIEKVCWHDHRPAVLRPDGKTVRWNDLPSEKLPEVFETHLPVCWSCHMTIMFQTEHPERVVHREPDPLRMSLYH